MNTVAIVALLDKNSLTLQCRILSSAMDTSTTPPLTMISTFLFFMFFPSLDCKVHLLTCWYVLEYAKGKFEGKWVFKWSIDTDCSLLFIKIRIISVLTLIKSMHIYLSTMKLEYVWSMMFYNLMFSLYKSIKYHGRANMWPQSSKCGGTTWYDQYCFLGPNFHVWLLLSYDFRRIIMGEMSRNQHFWYLFWLLLWNFDFAEQARWKLELAVIFGFCWNASAENFSCSCERY